MKEQKNSLEFFGLLLILAAAVAFLSAGTAMAEQGGLPVCMDNLNTCTTDLDTCLNDLAQAQENSTTNQTGTNRFTDNGDGTVTDNQTGLVWMKNSQLYEPVHWFAASGICTSLEEGGDLTDGSSAGDWRLPDIEELQSLIDYGQYNPALPFNHPFDVQSSTYWSSTTCVDWDSSAWSVSFYTGVIDRFSKSRTYYVWCVRDGNIN